ncbi:MAG: rod shape-determining protein MreD [Chloroflexota bacterium]|nr:rod shape-determining protein MreD [Chloroflexota bacterium]
MSFLAFAALVTLAALVEATVGYRLELGNGRANLVLLLVVAWALLRGKEEGLLAGLIGGVALDMVSGAPFGLHAALLALVGGTTGLGAATLAHGGATTLFGLAVLVTVAYHAAEALALGLLGWLLPGPARLLTVMTPTVLLNGVLLPGVFVLARRLERLLSGWRQLELE